MRKIEPKQVNKSNAGLEPAKDLLDDEPIVEQPKSPRRGRKAFQVKPDQDDVAEQREPRPVIPVKLTDLKEHPEQASLFTIQQQARIEELANDLKFNGQLTPIEICTDYTIICGHQRVRAAGQLGWTEINAVIRDDLGASDNAQVIDRLVTDNLTRRQMNIIEVARCLEALKKAEKNLPSERRLSRQGPVRDLIAARFKKSGRQAARYMEILKAPIEVQDAVGEDLLTAQAGCAVAKLPAETKEAIAKEIRDGESPKVVVARYLPKRASKHVDVRDARASFVRSLQRGLDDLNGRVEGIRKLAVGDLETLVAAQQIIKNILTQTQAKKDVPTPTKAVDTTMAAATAVVPKVDTRKPPAEVIATNDNDLSELVDRKRLPASSGVEFHQVAY